MRKIAILGATGSVGGQALEVARAHKEEIEVVCLSAHGNVEKLAAAANEFRPAFVALTDEGADATKLARLLEYDATVLHGKDANVRAATECGCDMVVLAVLGIAGLECFAACLQNHIPVALANKESLVCGGEVICDLMDKTGTMVLPVDSEHMAIFQCLGSSYDVKDVENIWLTASGGPFLRLSKKEIDNAPPERALKHPNWDMGRKISIDSASLANKGLEVIEAHFMYRMPGERIKVVVQPQSLIHSMVEFRDSTVLAQFGPVDMRLPLQRCMLHPNVCKFSMNEPLNFGKLGIIEFIEPDMERFPCLGLAYDAIETGMTAVYNIADEVAVDLYLEKRIRFGQIAEVISRGMEAFGGEKQTSVPEILELDERVRRYVLERY